MSSPPTRGARRGLPASWRLTPRPRIGGPPMDERLVATPVGTARLDWYAAQGAQRATVVLGHGTATGIEAADLQTLARALPSVGIEVVLVTQPYLVEGNYEVADEQSLDRAWTAIWPRVSGGGV